MKSNAYASFLRMTTTADYEKWKRVSYFMLFLLPGMSDMHFGPVGRLPLSFLSMVVSISLLTEPSASLLQQQPTSWKIATDGHSGFMDRHVGAREQIRQSLFQRKDRFNNLHCFAENEGSDDSSFTPSTRDDDKIDETPAYDKISELPNTPADMIKEQQEKTMTLLTPTLIKSLDLDRLLFHVASHCGTRRGQSALLSMVVTGQHDWEELNRLVGRRGSRLSLRRFSQQQQQQQGNTDNSFVTSRQRRLRFAEQEALETRFRPASFSPQSQLRRFQCTVADSVDEAKKEYKLVRQATLFLKNHLEQQKKQKREPQERQEGRESTKSSRKNHLVDENQSFVPPLYPVESDPFDFNSQPETDDDEWLHDYTDRSEYTLQDILKAEQVIGKFLKVHNWALLYRSVLSKMCAEEAERMEENSVDQKGRDLFPDDRETNILSIVLDIISIDSLERIHKQYLQNAVEIVRVRSITDPLAKSSYQFRLRSSEFPALQSLLQQQDDAQQKLLNKNREPRKGGSKLEQQLKELKEQIQTVESETQYSLACAIWSIREEINDALNAMAHLDTIFAKAAFGLRIRGQFPCVGKDAEAQGTIYVPQFRHPLLQLTSTTTSGQTPNTPVSHSVVAVDLKLGTPLDAASEVYENYSFVCNDERHNAGRSDSVNNQRRALIISGMNGGGKTLSLKSFGLVSLMVRLGLPIPCSSSTPLVDFFDSVVVSMGDGQDISKGQSTFLSQLNFYSELLNGISDATKQQPRKTLILLDELGSGTEAQAGGAIAQAILEKILQHNNCRVVATTHSARLKAFSFENREVDCASVLPELDDSNGEFFKEGHEKKLALNRRQRPTFQLQYGVIGESLAIDAASRCDPALPRDVLNRATTLLLQEEVSAQNPASYDALAGGGFSHDYSRALKKSLEKQLRLADSFRGELEERLDSIRKCQHAMLILADSYDRQLSLLEQRIERCYQELKDGENESGAQLEIVGDTLSELRVVKKKIISQAELLRQRGLRPLSATYEITKGESVVIIAEGEWDGTTGTVAEIVGNNAVGGALVVPSRQPWADNDPYDLSLDDFEFMTETGSAVDGVFTREEGETESRRPLLLLFQRHELAVWDYESVWDYDESNLPSTTTTTSVSDSRRRMNSVLASIKKSTATGKSSAPPSSPSSPQSLSSFKSARERKAVSKTSSAKKKKGSSKKR